MDDRLGERLPGTTSRCHGCSSADARKGSEQRRLKYHYRADGTDADRRKWRTSYCHRASERRDGLRSLVRFNGGLWRFSRLSHIVLCVPGYITARGEHWHSALVLRWASPGVPTGVTDA